MSAVELALGTKFRKWEFVAYEIKAGTIGYRFRCQCGGERVFKKTHVAHGAATMPPHCKRCRLRQAKARGWGWGNPKERLFWQP